MALCPSLCLSVTRRHCIEMAERIELFFLVQRLPSTYPTLCWRVIWVYPQIMVLSLRTLSQTLDLEISLVNCHKCCQVRWMLSVINCWQSSVASLSHWAFTFVNSTVGSQSTCLNGEISLPLLITCNIMCGLCSFLCCMFCIKQI